MNRLKSSHKASPGEQVVERGDVGKPARAYESLEKMAGIDVGNALNAQG